ncbi:MAG TPA: ABC transporter permease [Bryobacteraceae bacterium]|jgi:ABC-2 type transport system permease protein|nr:ABC transporter permease [Bryobacteraceae bacterium]
MHKILLVAKRDYLAAIRSKAFLFSLVIAPIMGGGSFIGVAVMKAKPDIQERRVAIVDRTGKAAAAVVEAAAEKNAEDLFDKITGRQLNPRYVFETAVPEDASPNAQRLSLSERVRRRELFAFLEIGRDALHPPKLADPDKPPESSRVDYYSNAGGIDQSLQWISAAVNTGLRRARLAELGVDRGRFADLLGSARVQTMGLIARDEKTGGIQGARKKSELEGFIVPFVLVIMLMMTVLFAVGPMLGAVAEDKMQRVFEMLLASATPFELIMGKVVAAVGLSLTSSAVYVVAGLFLLQGLAMMGLAPLGLLPWFVVYVAAEVMVLCALAAALGSACASPSDAQHLAMPLFAPVLIPMFLLQPVMQQPNGMFAVALSLFPPLTPPLMMMRQAMPGGVPAWQPWVGLVGIVVWTVVVAWAAARIFRIGILMQGKTASFPEMMRWAIRG